MKYFLNWGIVIILTLKPLYIQMEYTNNIQKHFRHCLKHHFSISGIREAFQGMHSQAF